MAAAIETSIWLALRSRIETLPFTPGLAMAFPASVFQPSGPYIAVGGVSAAPERVMVNRGAHERNGTLSLTHVAPLGQDASVYVQAAATIAAHFPDDLRIRYGDACVRVTAWPSIPGGYRDGGWWHEPVLIPWQVLT